jgi:hypothetical protein
MAEWMDFVVIKNNVRKCRREWTEEGKEGKKIHKTNVRNTELLKTTIKSTK